MKSNFILMMSAVMLGLVGCEQDTTNFDQNVASEDAISFVLEDGEMSRVSQGVFESGDVVMFDAYATNGELFANNKSYVYNDGKFSSNDPIYYPMGGGELTFVGCYPSLTSLYKTFTYSAPTNQSTASELEKSDLLICKSTADGDLQPSVEFSHVMSNVVITITNSSVVPCNKITVSAKNQVYCNVETMKFSSTGNVATINPFVNNNTIEFMVAPQTIAKGTTLLNATVNGVSYKYTLSSPAYFEPGKRYAVNCTMEEISTPSVETYRSGWAELPNEIVKKGDYYYAHHTVTATVDKESKTVRNLSVCYSDKFTCPVWVAGPMHRFYAFGSGDRRNNYRDDPKIPCYQVETLGSPYNRGHMFASSDRLGNQEMNNQAFYLSNIGPQLISGFNTGGGIWNNYEDWIQADYQNRSDTLYMVNGCHWENTNKVVKGTTVPTHYYKAVLRCKQRNSTKRVQDCSRDELECVVFYLEHKSSTSKPNRSHMISVEALEKKTGFTYFGNVPNAPKDSFNASDWGL